MIDRELCPEILKASLRAYCDRRPTGGFLRAVLENDLKMAVLRADNDNVRLIPEIVAFAVETVPTVARGSKEAVRVWLATCRHCLVLEGHAHDCIVETERAGNEAYAERAEFASSHGQQNDEEPDGL